MRKAALGTMRWGRKGVHPPGKKARPYSAKQSPGCSAALSSAAPGLRPNWFWGLPGNSDWASAALTFPCGILSGSTSVYLSPSSLLAAGGNSGGLRPTPFPSSQFGQAPKPTSPSATLSNILPHEMLPRDLPVAGQVVKKNFVGGWEIHSSLASPSF